MAVIGPISFCSSIHSRQVSQFFGVSNPLSSHQDTGRCSKILSPMHPSFRHSYSSSSWPMTLSFFERNFVVNVQEAHRLLPEYVSCMRFREGGHGHGLAKKVIHPKNQSARPVHADTEGGLNGFLNLLPSLLLPQRMFRSAHQAE